MKIDYLPWALLLLRSHIWLFNNASFAGTIGWEDIRINIQFLKTFQIFNLILQFAVSFDKIIWVTIHANVLKILANPMLTYDNRMFYVFWGLNLRYKWFYCINTFKCGTCIFLLWTNILVNSWYWNCWLSVCACAILSEAYSSLTLYLLRFLLRFIDYKLEIMFIFLVLLYHNSSRGAWPLNHRHPLWSALYWTFVLTLVAVRGWALVFIALIALIRFDRRFTWLCRGCFGGAYRRLRLIWGTLHWILYWILISPIWFDRGPHWRMRRWWWNI